jgi:hypothetical protein
MKCPDCGSKRMRDHPNGIECRACGFSAPGDRCAKCKRQSVGPHHVTPEGKLCFQSTRAVPRAVSKEQGKLVQKKLVRPKLPPEPPDPELVQWREPKPRVKLPTPAATTRKMRP